jgi:hypothetical protein
MSPLKRVKAVEVKTLHKGDTVMKRNAAIALIALSTLAAGSRALAQEPGVKATVPFEFTVAGKLLPADTYTITSSSQGVITIQSADKRSWVETTASRGSDESTKGSELVFEKYGQQYFLHQVICPTVASMNVKVPTSKLEKRVQIQEARLGGVPEPVLIAAR